MGEMPVPADALYGATTARAVQNFPIANRPLPAGVIHAYGHLKAACAIANRDLGLLDAKLAVAIVAAADEVAAGVHDSHFPVDVYQTGSGTSTNMNVNEVIATLATRRGSAKVHPNDHVNVGQSSNDTFPSAMHIAGRLAIEGLLRPATVRLGKKLAELALRFDHIIKVGRTHLMDATPIRVGQVFAGYAAQMRSADRRLAQAAEELRSLAIGGTAVGTGLNTHADFARRVCESLSARTGQSFVEAADHCEAQATRDAVVFAHGCLKTVAIGLSKIASDIRLLASGPRCGVGEIVLPAIQPGSSIMPGKENPVVCESVMQVACRVIGNDATVSIAGAGGVGGLLELNVAMPVMADALLESIHLLANVQNVLVDKLLSGLRIDEHRCRELLEASLMNVTVLAPAIGYDAAAKVAKSAQASGKPIRATVLEGKLLPADQLDVLLDYDRMTRPSD